MAPSSSSFHEHRTRGGGHLFTVGYTHSELPHLEYLIWRGFPPCERIRYIYGWWVTMTVELFIRESCPSRFPFAFPFFLLPGSFSFYECSFYSFSITYSHSIFSLMRSCTIYNFPFRKFRWLKFILRIFIIINFATELIEHLPMSIFCIDTFSNVLYFFLKIERTCFTLAGLASSDPLSREK